LHRREQKVNEGFLQGKTAVVTGAAMGIGRATAIRLAQAGCNVALGDIREAEGDKVAGDLEAAGHQALAVPTDVRRRDSVQQLFAKTCDRFGRIDILVTSAGVRFMSSIPDVSEDEWNETFSVNVAGMFNCIQAVVPYLRRMGSGKIINVGSVSGLRGLRNRAPYCASKAAVHGLTRQTAAELAQFNIQVNAVAPGYVETPMTDMYSAEVVAAMVKGVPAGRRCGPEEVADAIIYLASPASDYITGAVLSVDGGLADSIMIDAWSWHTNYPALEPQLKSGT
jgi:3-oxoacyl-[acyl-carrier protein] reductase